LPKLTIHEDELMSGAAEDDQYQLMAAPEISGGQNAPPGPGPLPEQS
jgi:hypothetical protein